MMEGRELSSPVHDTTVSRFSFHKKSSIQLVCPLRGKQVDRLHLISNDACAVTALKR